MRHQRGFTLTEVLVVLGLLSFVGAAALSVIVFSQRLWLRQSTNVDATREASLALFNIVYGGGGRSGLRAVSDITTTTNGAVFFTRPNGTTGSYQLKDDTIVDETGRIVCRDVEELSFTRDDDDFLTVRLRVRNTHYRFSATNQVEAKVLLRNEWE